MISGALLLDPRREQSLGSFYRRRVAKVVVPLLCRSVLYAGWRIHLHGEALGPGEFARHLV